MPPLRLTAAWLVPVSGPAVRDGALLIGENGRIVAAGPDREVPHPPGTPERRLVRCALLPGLVNAHTHLELTGLAGRVTDPEFPGWIAHLRQVKADRSPGDFLAAARHGLRRSFEAGVTTIADTGDSGAVIEALAESGASGVAYHEVFGPDPIRLESSVREMLDRMEALRRFEGPRVRLGVSPHAPYTVSGPLYRAVADFARRRDLPLAVHLAESAAETELLEGRGAFADAWTARRIPLPGHPAHEPPSKRPPTPVEWLDWFGVLGRRTLCIHLVRVSDADIAILERQGVGVAHCPRSNRRHGHGEAPLRALLDAGLAVGVGTDSEVSVGPPDLLAEACAARKLAGLDAGETLRLVTLDAARAIGVDGEIGSLDIGKWGDVVAIHLGRDAGPEEIHEAVLDAGTDGVVETWLGGRSVARRNPSP